MKFLMLFLLLTLGLFAEELTVKKGDVVVGLNGVDKALKKGDKITLEDAVLVCFKSGNGRVIINKRRQLSKKSKKCYQTPIPKGFSIESYMTKAKNVVSVAFLDSAETVRHGVSTKGIKDFDDKKDILVKSSSEEVVIYSKEFGPHPILVSLKDNNGKEILSYENEENDVTFFKVKSSIVKTGYIVEVKNGFDEILLSKQIVKE